MKYFQGQAVTPQPFVPWFLGRPAPHVAGDLFDSCEVLGPWVRAWFLGCRGLDFGVHG